jgi:glycine betaine/proline transport system ATP-binding protein
VDLAPAGYDEATRPGAADVGAAAGPGPPPVLECRNVWKVFGPRAQRIVGSAMADLPRAELARVGNVAAVRDISFSVPSGELFVVMGLSGSGKSTLVRCLSRLIEPTAGQVLIDGEDVTAVSAERLRELRRTKMSMVFQHFGLLPHRRLLDNVAFGLEVQGKDKASRLRRANEMLELVGLGGLGDSYPDQLSGGMQQRVGLARALANEPEILLFDEPFSALDPLIRRDMQDEVARLQRELRKTTVFITHDLSEALKLGDRIAIMKDGRFVQVGTPAEVVGQPADAYVRAFTRDVQRGQVLRADAVMGPPPAVGTTLGPAVDVTTQLSELVRRVAASEDPLPVVDADGRTVGTIDRVRVLTAMAGDILDAEDEAELDDGQPAPTAAELVELAELESVDLAETSDDLEHR